MIATHKNIAEFARAIDYLVGAGAVTHKIAEVVDEVIGRGRTQAGLKSFEIRVNVAEKKYAHSTPDGRL